MNGKLLKNSNWTTCGLVSERIKYEGESSYIGAIRMNDQPQYPSMAVANWFIENLSRVDPLKLQKLVYFAHGWHLALRDQPLIDELVEAWDYGPVVPSLYHQFKRYGNQSIP